jgi:hypothetical protein
MEKIYQVKELISQVNDKEGYFIDFVISKISKQASFV